ncbi:hypothetical protein LAZ67_7000807, partial [Cordylochernes scorpioides]
MTYLAKVRKCDLSKLAYELGEVVPPESRIVDLKHLILNSQSYEEEFAKQLLETLIEDRERIEERERIEDRKRIEDRERIERERKEQMVMEFELEKLRIQTTRGNNDTSRSTSNDAHYEIRKLMPKYESKDNDLSFYLILFERQAKRLGLDEDQWAFSLLGLLPYEMTQLIARETEEQSGDYRFVKRLHLKRYKLSPEQFRQKFEKHERSQKGSWRDFAFELRGYFNEWIEGMNVENFDALKDLSITNQLKKKVPNVLRNHLIDDWTKLNNPDEYAKHLIPPSFQQKSARFPNQSEVKETKQGTNVSGQDAARNEISETYPNTLRRMVNRTIRNDKGEPKCFNCNQFGHIARDCPAPRTTLACRGCGQTGHKERNCTRPKEGLKVANLEVEGLETVPPDVYLKNVKIDNKETVKAMIDTGSSSCLMRESVARRISVDIEPDSTSLYGIGNQTAPAARTVGKTTVDLEIDGIVGREITVFIVNDDAQPYDLLIGRTWTDLPYVSFARIGKNLHIGFSSEFPFANLQEEIKSRRIELRATETVQLESDSINFTSAITDEVKDGYVLFTGIDDACVDSLLEVVDGKTTVPIISAGKGKLRVRKNQCVGRVELLNLDDIVVNLDVAEDSFQTKNEEKREGQDQMKRKRPILPEDINVNHSLTSKERQEILDVVNEYRDCFALGMEELGCTDVTKMDIKEVDGSKPVCLRPYKTTGSEREAIREIVREWKDNGIVTEIRSPYASPVLLVRRKTGDHRLVVDYRRLNIQTVKDKFPLPRIDDLLEGLRNAKFFTTLDLAHGYLQIPLTDKAKLKTAFITPDDTGQFERMIFGLANAPAEFQRLMHTVLGPLLNKKAFCYLDDVIIPAKDWREMIERLREVLERIRSAKLTLKPSKWEKMAHVDGMSRAPVDDPRDTMEEIVEKNLEVCLTITLEEQILMIQHSDPELRDLIQIFRKDPCDRTVGEQNRINDYSYKGGRLFRMVKNGEEERALYVIPKSMRKSLVVKFHDLMGHFATDRTVNKIKELYWFPSMKRYVRRHVAMCLECLFNKVPGGKQQGFLHPIKSGKRPFSIVHMDHVGPFVRSTKGNQELLVIVDNLTRFVRLSPVRNTSTQNVLKVMKSFVNDFGLPDKIISDRGSCFTSRQFEEFCRGNGIHHTLNSTKHPQGNGMVERVNRTVLSTIATSIEDPRRKDWDLKIKEVERDLNNAVNKTTNKTPFETLHGYSPRFHDGILRRLADEDVDPWTEPDRIQESVRTQIENKQEIMKTYYDKKKCRTIQFEVGEIVVMRHVPKMTGEPTKAQPKYRGPLIITEVLPSDTYRVTQLSERTSGRFYTTTAHISQLKSWHSEEDDSATEESPDEEPEVEDTPRRNPRRSCNARFNRGRLKSRNGRIPIDIIIGADLYLDLIEPGLIKGPRDAPSAMNSKLGWIISGRSNMPNSTTSTSIQQIHVNHSSAELDDIVKKFWDAESIPTHKEELNTEELECENIFRTTTFRDENERYVVSLPFKLNYNKINYQLGDSKSQALRRFLSLERRFHLNPVYSQHVREFMQEYLNLGHMEVINEIEPEQPSHQESGCLESLVLEGWASEEEVVYGLVFILAVGANWVFFRYRCKVCLNVTMAGQDYCGGRPLLDVSKHLEKLEDIIYSANSETKQRCDNSNVDALSRLPLESSVRESLDEDQVLLRKLNEVPFSFMEVAYETSQDKILSIVLSNVREGNYIEFHKGVPRENPLAPHYKINEELSLEFGCLQWRERMHNTTMLASFSRVECRGDESTPGPPLCTGGYPQVFPGRIFEDSPLGYGALFVFVHSRSSGLDSCSTYLV